MIYGLDISYDGDETPSDAECESILNKYKLFINEECHYGMILSYVVHREGECEEDGSDCEDPDYFYLGGYIDIDDSERLIRIRLLDYLGVGEDNFNLHTYGFPSLSFYNDYLPMLTSVYEAGIPSPRSSDQHAPQA